MTNPLVSIIIPNYNGANTLRPCLRTATSLMSESVELIVVDDASTDDSITLIRQFPCKVIQMDAHGGAARARNIGAAHSRGEWLFFTDADCLLSRQALSLITTYIKQATDDRVIGGSYTPRPYDDRFLSRFQSMFIHYFETRHAESPDYLATHALLIKAKIFRDSGGFAEDIGPILEDVEFSHRLRRAGLKLQMLPALQVQHIFNYSLLASWRNAIRKTRYWIRYSLANGDLLADSGTASRQLKVNVCVFYLSLVLLGLASLKMPGTLGFVAILVSGNVFLQRGLFKVFYRHAGSSLSGLGAMLYYLCIYPLPVGMGALAGLAGYLQQAGHNRYR